MKKTLTKILLTIFGGGIALAAPIVPAEVAVHGQFDTKEKVETHRKYLKERSAYITENADRLNLPQKTRDSATVAKDNWEEKLLEDGFIDVKGGQVKEKPTKRHSVIETVVSMDWVQRAYAFTFGKEDFESCGAAPCSFDADGSYGSGQMNLDSTSKVNGTDSARCDVTAANDGCLWYKDVTSDDEYWYQMTVFLPTGFVIGASGYLSLFNTGDGVGAPVYCSLEDYGPVRITCAGDELGYTDTGVNVPLNTATKLEFRIKIGAATGDFDIWINNNTEGSPDYNGSGTLNTGTQNITYIHIGGYNPDIVNDRYYDDVILNTGFIGAGVGAPVFKSTLRGGLKFSGSGTIK